MTCKLIASFATILELLPDPLCLKEKMQIWINQFLSLFSTMMMDSFRHLKKKIKHVGFWDMQNYKERNTSCLPGARSYLSSTSCIVSGRGEPSVSGRNIAATPLRTGAPP